LARTIHCTPGIPEREKLIVHGPDGADLLRRAGDYVDKILRGTKPTDLPVEQPIKYELIINMKTAKALGLTVPPSILVRATEVIGSGVLHCMSLELALSGHLNALNRCPLSGEKRTLLGHAPMSASDPTATSVRAGLSSRSAARA
jgi:hypothetical protein